MTRDVNVNVEGLIREMRDQADSLAGLIWERMNYWFL